MFRDPDTGEFRPSCHAGKKRPKSPNRAMAKFIRRGSVRSVASEGCCEVGSSQRGEVAVGPSARNEFRELDSVVAPEEVVVFAPRRKANPGLGLLHEIHARCGSRADSVILEARRAARTSRTLEHAVRPAGIRASKEHASKSYILARLGSRHTPVSHPRIVDRQRCASAVGCTALESRSHMAPHNSLVNSTLCRKFVRSKSRMKGLDCLS